MPRKRGGSNRELIDTGRDKRYVRRDDEGRFKEVDDTGRSLARDIRRRAKTEVSLARAIRATRGETSEPAAGPPALQSSA